VLLDPFFTERHLFGMFRCQKIDIYGKSVGSLTLQQAAESIDLLFRKGVPTEVHLSSPFPESAYLGTPVLPFEPLVVLIRRLPKWCGNVISVEALEHVGCQHKAAVILYFLAGGIRPQGNNSSVEACDPSLPLGCSDEQLWRLQQLQQTLAEKGQQQVWLQQGGRETRRTDDDSFTREVEPLGDEGMRGVQEFKSNRRAKDPDSVRYRPKALATPFPGVEMAVSTTQAFAVLPREVSPSPSLSSSAPRREWRIVRVMLSVLLLASSVACCWMGTRRVGVNRRKSYVEVDDQSESDQSPTAHG